MKDYIETTCNWCGERMSASYPSLRKEKPEAPSIEEAREVEQALFDRKIEHQNTVCEKRPKEKDCDCGKDALTLKWGTLKAWHFHTANARRLLSEYMSLGASASAAMQKDSVRQQDIICELIDECNGTIFNDWEGKEMTKKEAKRYVREY